MFSLIAKTNMHYNIYIPYNKYVYVHLENWNFLVICTF